ncbi:hypothetical protein U1Q18_012995 [Sarracenia purpurea var. burkii]
MLFFPWLSAACEDILMLLSSFLWCVSCGVSTMVLAVCKKCVSRGRAAWVECCCGTYPLACGAAALWMCFAVSFGSPLVFALLRVSGGAREASSCVWVACFLLLAWDSLGLGCFGCFGGVGVGALWGLGCCVDGGC